MSTTRDTIIIVDDNLTSLTAGKNILKTFYQVIPVTSAQDMFEVLLQVKPDLILLDIEMPEIDGYQAIKKLKENKEYSDIPVIFLTARDDSDSEIEGFDLGAVDYISKPFSAPLLLKRIEKDLLIVKQKNNLLKVQTELKTYLKNLEKAISENVSNIQKLHDAVYDTLIDMVEYRDIYTGGHIMRTQYYVKILYDELVKEKIYFNEILDWDEHSVLVAAKLHDVGKIAVSDVILGKNERLTEVEFETMKAHVTAGVDIIERVSKKTGESELYNHAIKMAGTHHEKWDGTGYPIGLKGNSIPIEGRIMAIADVYDALISVRPYKDSLSHEQACELIEKGVGTQFDPVLIKVFKNVKDEFAKVIMDEK